jgi:hypothetical protein
MLEAQKHAQNSKGFKIKFKDSFAFNVRIFTYVNLIVFARPLI